MRTIQGLVPVALAGFVLGLVGTVVTAEDDQAGGAIRGDVGDRDGVTAGAEIAAGVISFDPLLGEFAAVTTTDNLGRFSLEGAPLGPIDIWVRPKDGKWKFALRMMNPGVNDLEINADPHREFPSGFGGFGDERGTPLEGVVLDKKGKPVAGAAVGSSNLDAAWVLTDEAGKFSLQAAGESVIVRASGFADQAIERKKKKKLKVKLATPKPTVVRVIDAQKQLVPGAWVTLGDIGGSMNNASFRTFPPSDRLVGGWTNQEGEAHIVWPGTRSKSHATAYAVGFAPARKGFSGGKRVTISLAPAIPLRATATLREGGDPLVDVLIGALHESSGGIDAISAVPGAQQRGPIVLGQTDANGQCVIPSLPLDSKTLCVVGEYRRQATVTSAPVGDDE